MTLSLPTSCPTCSREIAVTFDDRVPHAVHCSECDAPLDWGMLVEEARDRVRDGMGEGEETL